MTQNANKDSSHAQSKTVAGYGLATVFWIAVWAIAALLVGNSLLLAGPVETLIAFGANLASTEFWQAVGLTSWRILATSILAALAGTIAGFIAAAYQPFRVLMAPLLQVLKSAPIACVIVVVLVAAGATGALIAIVAFVAFPPFYVAATEAQAARESRTEEVLELAGTSRLKVFLASTWPAMQPFFVAAAKTAVALSWRAGITAELLCIPLGSMGEAVYDAKLTLDSAGLLMWTIIVMVLSWISEKVAVGLLDFTGRSPKWAMRLSPTIKPAEAGSTQAASTPRPSKPGSSKPGSSKPGSSTRMPSTLSVKGAYFSYRNRSILEAFDLEVALGARVCLMAPTGSGKTTLLNVMTGKLKPQRGRVSRPSVLGVVFQQTTLIESLSATDNVLLTCSSARSKQAIEAELNALLPAGTADKPARELSGGTRRLTELARALFSGGEAILLDEPFAGLDPESKMRACDFIMRNLCDRPLVIATHDSNDALLLGASIVHL